MMVIKKGSNWIHILNDEFVTVTNTSSDWVWYQDNMGVKGSLPIKVFLDIFRECKD